MKKGRVQRNITCNFLTFNTIEIIPDFMNLGENVIACNWLSKISFLVLGIFLSENPWKFTNKNMSRWPAEGYKNLQIWKNAQEQR